MPALIPNWQLVLRLRVPFLPRLPLPKALTESLGVVSKWSDDTAEIDKNPFLRTITDFYKLAIVAVDGNTDRTFVDNFVMNMPALHHK
jgi:hypothetical protein